MAGWYTVIVFAVFISPASFLEGLESFSHASSRIVGGSDAEISKYPYQLAILNDGYHYCGASVVAEQWALTAGHCCQGYDIASLTIRGGSSVHNQGGLLFTVAKIVIHPSYDSDNLNFDVCMIEIRETFLGHVNVAIIPLSNSAIIPANEVGTVSGWGATMTDGESVIHLRATNVKIYSEKSCNAATRNFVSTTSSMFCAGNVGSSICVGDSGGPLVHNQRQIGIVSFIILECAGVVPAVYTRIANSSIRSFINQQINSRKMNKNREKARG